MKTEIDLVLLALCLVFLGLMAGTHSAMQLLSYARSEKNGDDDADGAGFVDRLVDDSVNNFFSIGLAQVLAILLVLFVSQRFVSLHLASSLDTTSAQVAFVAFCVLAPWGLANLIALRSPERFVGASRFALYPVIYLLRPPVYVVVRGLGKLSPRLLAAMSFPVLTFQKRIDWSLDMDAIEFPSAEKSMWLIASVWPVSV